MHTLSGRPATLLPLTAPAVAVNPADMRVTVGDIDVEVDDVGEGTLVHHVLGASAPRLLSDQVRGFRFLSDDELVLQPPPGPGGAQSALRWRRLPAAERIS